VNTFLSAYSPKVGENVTVAGHPFLNPFTISEGYMSNNIIVDLIVGVRECTKKELRGSLDVALLCLFLGGIPIVKTFNSAYITAIIAPGNSGSAVYNSNGEIVGLVFAGKGRDLSHGIIVPHVYIRDFLVREVYSLK